MTEPREPRALTPLDCLFLSLEKPTTPMSIGCMAVFDAQTPSGPMTYDRFRVFVAERLRDYPIFRRKLVVPRWGLGTPVWVEDRDFDLDLHLTHISLPECSGIEALRQVCAREFGRTLAPDRPLWEMTYVSHFSNADSCVIGKVAPRPLFALVLKIHHAAADGVAFESLLHHWLSNDPAAGASVRTPRPSLRAVESPRHEPRERPGSMAMVSALAGSLFDTITSAMSPRRRQKQAPRPMLDTPVTPISAPVSARRQFQGVHFSLSELAALSRRHARATVNDLVLTLCGTALRDYLLQTGALPDRSLVCMVPVARRRVHAEAAVAGNQVSAMLVSLHTDGESILERLDAICDQTQHGKSRGGGLSLRTLVDLLPVPVVAGAMALYSHASARGLGWAPFNLVITNVPGPHEPLYLDGARLLAIEGHAPIYDGIGLTIVINSYQDVLSVALTSCPSTLPQPERLIAALKRACAALRGVLQGESIVPERAPPKLGGAAR